MPLANDRKLADEISTNDVRGGVTGNGVRYVLGISLAGAVVALAALYWLFYIHH